MSKAFELVPIGANPRIISTMNVMVSGRCPDGVVINLLGINYVDEINDATAVAFEVIVPQGMRESNFEGSIGTSTLYLTLVDDTSNIESYPLYYQVSFKTEDANSMNWELDFNVKTSKNSGTYTFTKKRFH